MAKNQGMAMVVGDAHEMDFNTIHLPMHVKIGDVNAVAIKSKLNTTESRLYEPYPNDQIRSGRYLFTVDDEYETSITLTFRGKDAMSIRDEFLKMYKNGK